MSGTAIATGSATALDALDARLAELRGGPGFRNYRRVRDWVLGAALPPATDGRDVSAYWMEELEGLNYMLDAGPLVIEKLRHHTYTVTGLRPYDYRSGKDAARDRFKAKRDLLVEMGDPELMVPESPLLGGFGYEFEDGLYNIDTLKYYEVLLALDRGGALGGFRNPPERRVVWEVGAGWGGFPYVFKTLFPDTSYLIVDLPEVFLYSGTYLLTAFPDATMMFYGEDDWDPARLPEVDFAFVPNTALDDFKPPKLDLTINMVSFQEMTGVQVETYVRHAFELGCPMLYSLNRERSHYNRELKSVSEIISTWFWPHRIPVLDVNYMKMPKEAGRKGAKKKIETAWSGGMEYQHIVGKRRVIV